MCVERFYESKTASAELTCWTEKSFGSYDAPTHCRRRSCSEWVGFCHASRNEAYPPIPPTSSGGQAREPARQRGVIQKASSSTGSSASCSIFSIVIWCIQLSPRSYSYVSLSQSAQTVTSSFVRRLSLICISALSHSGSGRP